MILGDGNQEDVGMPTVPEMPIKPAKVEKVLVNVGGTRNSR